MPPQIFKNKVIATAGPLPRQLTIENLKKWTEIRRGTFVTEFDETVTHLLCTRDQFRDKRNTTIKKALQKRPGRRNVKVVHYEWYEFSAAYNERIPEQKYLMAGREADRRAKKREERRWQKGLEAGIDGVNPNLHHVYYDRDNFRYQITLVHKDPEMGYVDEKYVLTLWESNAWPHLYWFTAKLTKSKNGRHFFGPVTRRDDKHSVKWKPAYKRFTRFFKSVCKIKWKDRVSHQGTQPTAFQYEPPTGGKPVGRRLRHSYEYCLEINAQTKKELGIVEPVEVEVDAEKVAGEEMEVDHDDDDEVDALREELMSEDEGEDGEMAKHGEEARDVDDVVGELDEDGDESGENAAPLEGGAPEEGDEEEKMEIATEDVSTQNEVSADLKVEEGESAEATNVDEDAMSLDKVNNASPDINAESDEVAIPESVDAKDVTDGGMSNDENVAKEVEMEYPTPISVSDDEEEQVIQPTEAVGGAVGNDPAQDGCDARCVSTGSGFPERDIQQPDVLKVRKKLPNARKKLPDERKKLPGERKKIPDERQKLAGESRKPPNERKKLPDGR